MISQYGACTLQFQLQDGDVAGHRLLAQGNAGESELALQWDACGMR